MWWVDGGVAVDLISEVHEGEVVGLGLGYGGNGSRSNLWVLVDSVALVVVGFFFFFFAIVCDCGGFGWWLVVVMVNGCGDCEGWIWCPAALG